MYKVISTFSGIGGSSQGYKQAGLRVIASVEFLDYQAENYRLNHPTTHLYQGNIRDLDPLAILADHELQPGELDILDGSPPCSSFSTNGIVSEGWGKVKDYGNKKQRTDDLFYEFIRFLTVIKPKVFVAENVSGLIKGKSIGHFNNFLRAFKAAGYITKAKLMNAANYGVPQARERVIFQGVRSDLNLEPVYPGSVGKIVTAAQALKGVIIDTTEDVSLSEIYRTYYSRTFPGEGMDKGSMRVGDGYKWFSCKRLHAHKPAFTLTAHVGSDLTHWSEPRNLYIGELKRLQSFPDNYILTGSRSRQAEGIGRSVPPKMMEAIGRSIATQILDKVSGIKQE
ncbi:DNA (cytosine-5-)-methyltransferase [Spirosoma sp. HMF4905]|uniref:Cytosine-specific methyltransferase n=1 Tax=Spirosoma arboris TaxID=2682092 RepID=A0A7K1SQK1_9BACT|nr:DNA cytosine methyltransferase [Spirosoma arboris]MVM36069.1 DNA (cytosine-5-)-methyltransferase [Spirosoma arboris]